MKYKIWIFTLAIAPVLLLTCTCTNDKNITGNGSQTGNAITAMLYNPGGSPAANAKVKFYPIHYNPRTGGLTKTMATVVDSTTTDDKGNYTAKLDTGTYNVLAAGDSGVVYQDSITVVKDSTVHPPADTLKAPGGLRGRVRLQPGDDARTVFILFLGTNTWSTPDDSTGKFTVTNMAEGTYRVRILTTLDAYMPKDTVLSVTAGKVDSLTHDIVLQYTGIPVPSGLKINYDTLKQIVNLSWNKSPTGRKVAGYNVYRQYMGSTDSSLVKIKSTWTDTVFHDSTGIQDQTYKYRIAVVDTQGTEGVKSMIDSVTIQPAFFVADTIFKVQGHAWVYAAEIDAQGNYVIVNGTEYNSTPANIERYSPSGILINSWSIPGGVEQWNVYNCLAMGDSNTIFVSTKNNMVIHYDTAGTILSQFQNFTKQQDSTSPYAVGTVRGFSLFKDTLYIGNTVNHSIVAFSTAGDSLFSWGQDGQGNGQFKNIVSIACDSSGLIYVEDAYNYGRVQVFERDGTFKSSFDFHQFEITSGGTDLVAAKLDIRGNSILVSGKNLYGFDIGGQWIFRLFGISDLNRSFFAKDGTIRVSTWAGQILALSRR
jgi:hypothetical protein